MAWARDGFLSAPIRRSRPVVGAAGAGAGAGSGATSGFPFGSALGLLSGRTGPAAGFTGSAGRWSGVVGSGMEEVAADGRDVGEDADAQHHDDAGGELAADPELVAEVDDRRGDDDVAEERDDEDLVVEDAVEVGPQAAEDRVHR